MDPGQFGVISVPSKNEELLVPGKPGVFVDQTSLGCLWIRQAWGVCGSGKPGVFVDQASLGCLWIRQAWGVCGSGKPGVFVDQESLGCFWSLARLEWVRTRKDTVVLCCVRPCCSWFL